MKDAITKLRTMTSGTFDAFSLSGPRNAKVRAEILSGLLGRKCKQSESGVTAIRRALFEKFAPQGDCLAERERNLCAIINATYGW